MIDKAQKLRTALNLHDAGMEMKRLQIARRNKSASTEELEALFQSWLATQKQEPNGFFRQRNSPKSVDVK
jgi:hypothetical protein